ncbi:MAG: YkgJ family cysteine cluster protein [Bacteroidetes bacterium]|nr:YkgJ family cysteine cluster protein [Bacteroidota bacterium]
MGCLAYFRCKVHYVKKESMQPVNLRAFHAKVKKHAKGMRAFLTRVVNKPPRKLEATLAVIDQEVWQEVDCLSCANCCKKMTPTFTDKDVVRISKHLGMTKAAFQEKWLYLDRSDDWINRRQPCQFLDGKTNMCSIYEVRPSDCASFPHLTRKPFTDYLPWHRQNIQYCPATYRMVEKLRERLATLQPR